MLQKKFILTLHLPAYIYKMIEARQAQKQAEKNAENPPEIPENYTREDIQKMSQIDGLSTMEINMKVNQKFKEIRQATEARREYAKAHGNRILAPKRITRTETILELIERGARAFEEDKNKTLTDYGYQGGN